MASNAADRHWESVAATRRSPLNAAAPSVARAASRPVESDRTEAMPRNRFKLVEQIGRTLPDVEVTTTWGQPTLKVRGTMFVCAASHKSAEPDTLVVKMAIADRDLLIEEDPDSYYLKEHYVGYPCVLVRLARVHPDALRDLIVGAHRYVSKRIRKKSVRRP
jgi:hypothetical protein